MAGSIRTARLGTRLTTAIGVMVMVASMASDSAISLAQTGEKPAEVRPWPCRLVVKPSLRDVIEAGWERSATLKQQCVELAAARAVVTLEWGKTDSQSHAVARIGRNKDVFVAAVWIPPVSDAVELVAHELEHVLERIRGVDFAAESKKRDSGVWRAFGGFETQGAIDAGRRVKKELGERPVATLPRLSSNAESFGRRATKAHHCED
jgi:hypothetical protein